MVQELARVLKPGGYGILLIPQTSVLHHAPEHYYNFTRFWITKAMTKANLEIIKLQPLGGRWSTTASHMVYFFAQSLKMPGYSTKHNQRNMLFYIFYPLMALFSVLSIPLLLILSLGDLSEEPNNHLVIVKKA